MADEQREAALAFLLEWWPEKLEADSYIEVDSVVKFALAWGQRERELFEDTLRQAEQLCQQGKVVRIIDNHDSVLPFVIQVAEAGLATNDELQREREEAERECIKAICLYCERGGMPKRVGSSDFVRWLHGLPVVEDQTRCRAGNLYELRRRRE